MQPWHLAAVNRGSTQAAGAACSSPWCCNCSLSNCVGYFPHCWDKIPLNKLRKGFTSAPRFKGTVSHGGRTRRQLFTWLPQLRSRGRAMLVPGFFLCILVQDPSPYDGAKCLGWVFPQFSQSRNFFLDRPMDVSSVIL